MNCVARCETRGDEASMKQQAPFRLSGVLRRPRHPRKPGKQAKKVEEPPCSPSSGSSSSSSDFSFKSRRSMEELLSMTSSLQLAPTLITPSTLPTQGIMKKATAYDDKERKTKRCQEVRPSLMRSENKAPSRRCMARRSSWYNPKTPWEDSERDDDDFPDKRTTPTRARSDDVLLHNMRIAIRNEDNVAINRSEHDKDNEPVRRAPPRTKSSDAPLYKISKEDTLPECKTTLSKYLMSKGDSSNTSLETDLDSSASSWADLDMSETAEDWEECLASIASTHSKTKRFEMSKANSARSMISNVSARSSLLGGSCGSGMNDGSDAEDNDLLNWC